MKNYIDCLPDNNLEKKFFKDIANNIEDYCIVAKNFGDPLPKIDKEKIILMNADEAYRIPEEVNDPSVKMIFKQYCYEDQNPKLKPIPLGCSKDLKVKYKPIRERSYDVTFIGQMARNRISLYAEIPNFLNDDSINCFFGMYKGFNKGLSMPLYSEILSETKIAICPHGTSSPETFRFFEAVSNGCIVLSPKMPDNWVYKDSPNFEDISYNMVKTILSQDIESLSEKTKEYHQKVSSDSVANYIKECLND